MADDKGLYPTPRQNGQQDRRAPMARRKPRAETEITGAGEDGRGEARRGRKTKGRAIMSAEAIYNCETTEQIEKHMADALYRNAYGQDWERVKGATLFLNKFGYEKPIEFLGWSWSNTFWSWSALVVFADGWRGYTYPRHDYK